MIRRTHTRAAGTIASCVVALATLSCDIRDEPAPVMKPVRPPVALPAPPPDGEGIAVSIREGDTTAFMDWLHQQPDPDAPIEDGIPPLLLAAEFGRVFFVNDLLAAGANPDITDRHGDTALHAAARSNHIAIIRALIAADADPGIIDAEGLTARDIATVRLHHEIASLLTEAMIHRAGTRGEKPESMGPGPEETVPEAVLLSTDFRTWTSAGGDRMEAAFIQSVFDMVILQGRSGELLRIALHRLSPEDQVLVRQLSGLDPHALAAARQRSSTGGTAPVRRSDSLALRIGQNPGWTVLDNCRLSRNDANDGDSFHVRHDGNDYIFRLYFVDAPETDTRFPERIEEQARYFRTSVDNVPRLGHEAARFTTSLLASAPFTVITRWEDARGSSELPRHYAMVVTPVGDLDELLTREGLVRQYGMDTEGSQRKRHVLERNEQEARRQKAGGWRE